MLWRSRLLLAALLLSSAVGVEQVNAAQDCSTKACISVRTNSTAGSAPGITITATQNSPGSAPVPKVHAKKARPGKRDLKTPVVHILRRPIPRSIPRARPSKVISKITTKSIVKRIVPIRPKLVAKKIGLAIAPAAHTVAPKIVAAVSLSDTITQLLPSQAMFYQPSEIALVQLPVYFWTDTNPIFQSTSIILGITVGVILNPKFDWDFGDGTQVSTVDRGGTFPNGKITHTYRTSGEYLVRMSISWSGTWSANGNSYPVLGQIIVQQMSTTIYIHPAPTLINN